MISLRKMKILAAIVEAYTETAEPVGSRTISKKYEFGISPATIRNEMSDLEDLGYIIQPHTSAGRIPSDKGYRLYVDNLMQQKKLTDREINFIKKTISNNVTRIDYLLKETAKAISLLTNYTTIMTEPITNKSKIKFLNFIPIDKKTLILVIVTNDNNAKNFTLKVNVPKKLDYISKIINKNLTESDIIDSNFYDKIFEQIGFENKNFMQKVIDAINSMEEVRIYTSGIKNILAFPEFHNFEKAQNIFEALEHHHLLSSIFNQDLQNDIEITIGAENQIDLFKDCSLIKTNYVISKDTFANIGILGPTRMNYSQVVSLLNVVENVLCNFVNEL